MATLKNKIKLVAVPRDNPQGSTRNNQSQNSAPPRENEEYVNQVSEEIEGMLMKKLSQEFSQSDREPNSGCSV